jgi:spore coat polysaccharide biosynthesis protein SpsF (cytidylyltransferase family)
MRKQITFLLLLTLLNSCGADKNKLMTDLINKQKAIKDSLDYYERIENNAQLSVDTLTDFDLLKINETFLDSFSKIRMNNLPTIVRKQKELEKINFSIDSLTKMK